MKLEKGIRCFLKDQCQATQEEIDGYFNSTVNIAEIIAFFSHQKQTRENGVNYFIHPYNCKTKYRNFVGIVENDPFCIDVELMAKYGIPFEGVQEVCLLHDVLEDTETTFEEIKEIYYDYGYEAYFELYINAPLKLITHDKNVCYLDYMKEVCKNPISAMAKLMDLVDNMNILQLKGFGEKEKNRTIDYVKYCEIIENEYHFIENVNIYLIKFNE